jgi:predicted small secreted protein
MKTCKRILFSIMVVAVLVGVCAGCGTMHGMGEDISSAGGALSDTSDNAKDKMTK